VIPAPRVELALASGPDDPAPVWQDVSGYALLSSGITVTRGRGDEFATVQPGQCGLILDNSDGRFTAGLASSPYYPNVKIGRRLRVSHRRLGTGNLLSAAAASFESGVVGWTAAGSVAPTLASSTLHPFSGVKSMLITWGAGGSFPQAATTVTGFVVGRTYTASMYVWVPAGSPAVEIVIAGIGIGSSSTSFGAQQRITYTFVATASSHDLLIWPATAPAAGNTAYIDAVQIDEGTAPGTFSTNPVPVSYRHTGHVDAWPVEWAPVAKFAQAALTSVDRFKRLGQISELTNVVSEEILQDAPAAYYTLGEPADSLTVGDTSAAGQPALAVTQLGTGGTLVFADSTGPGTDGLPAPTLTPSSSTAGLYLAGALTTGVGFTALSLRASFTTVSSGTQRIAAVVDGYGSYVELGTAAGKLTATVKGAFEGVLAAITSASGVNDSSTHDAEVTLQPSGGTVTVTLYLDGAVAGSATFAGSTLPLYVSMTIGGSQLGALFAGAISHVAAFSAALNASRVAVHRQAVITGFAGESSDARIARYARWAAVPDLDLESGGSRSIAWVDTTGKAPLQAMQDVVDTESGVLFVDGAGALVMQARGHRYAVASVLVLDSADTSDDPRFQQDDQFLANDVTTSREGGITFRAKDQASIDDYGLYRKTITLLTTDDHEVAAAASWAARRQSDPAPRMSSLTVDLLTVPDALADAVLGLEVGDRVTVTNLPPQAPSTSVDLFIEGMSETCSLAQWTVTFNTSPASQSDVLVLDDPVYGALDAFPLAY